MMAPTSSPSVKQAVLVIASILASCVVWWAAQAWLHEPDRFTSLRVMALPLLEIALATSVTLIAWVLLGNYRYRLAATLGSWATFILFFDPNLWFLSVLPVMAYFWFEAGRRVDHDLQDRLKVRIRVTVRQAGRLILVGYFLMISLGFFLMPSSQEVGIETVQEGVRTSVESTYKQDLVAKQLAQLPKSAQAQIRKDIGGQIDMWVERLLGPFGTFIPPILAFMLFLSLYSVSLLFRLIAEPVAVMLFEVLLKMGFVKIVSVQVSSEGIQL
jgi:hypothetical protein